MPTPTEPRVVIMAVPWDTERVRNVKRMREQVPRAEVVWDEKHSIIDTFTRALGSVGDDPAVFLQDDVYLHPRWDEKVAEVLAEHAHDVCQFFSIRKADLALGSRYVPGRQYLMNQCFYLPSGAAADLRAFALSWWEANPEHTGDDTCMALWLAASGRRYWHHVPSLVQHHEWKSAIDPRRSSKRQSPTFKEQQ